MVVCGLSFFRFEVDSPVGDGKDLAALVAGTEARGNSSQQVVVEVEWCEMWK